MFCTPISGHGSAQPIVQKLVKGCVLRMDEGGKLPGHHGEDPGGRAETEGKSSELEDLAFEGHSEELPGLGMNGNVEVSVFEVDAVRHVPGRRAALMDSADSILKRLGFRKRLRAFRSTIGQTPPDFLGTTKIRLKKPGPATGEMGSRALFSKRALNCSWSISILPGSLEAVMTEAAEVRGRGFSKR